MSLAHEDVERREIPMEQLPAMQLAENLEDARDLTSHGGFRQATFRSLQERAQVSVRRVFERQRVEERGGLLVHAEQRELVEDADRPRMTVEELTEIRLP